MIFYPSFVAGAALIGMALVSGTPAGAARARSAPAVSTSAASMSAGATVAAATTGASMSAITGALKPAASGPSACQARLSSDRAVFKPLGDLSGASLETGLKLKRGSTADNAKSAGPAVASHGDPTPQCGAPDAVLLQRIILEDHTEVAVEPPATLRCEMAEAVTEFVRHDLASAAAGLGSPLRSVENYDSFDCRSRNGVAGAKLSEHGLANALDIRSIRLKDGRVVHPTDAGASPVFRNTMKTAACERFTTVLGPGSDGYHEDHIHLDHIERRSGYRMCQWDVRDEPKFALQSVSTKSAAASPPPGAASAALRGPVPLPRPNPFKATGARVVILPAESHHR